MSRSPHNNADQVTEPGSFITYLAEQLRHHGLTFLLLGVMVWYFQTENEKIKDEVRACNDALIEMYRTDRLEMLSVINNNTAALNAIRNHNY